MTDERRGPGRPRQEDARRHVLAVRISAADRDLLERAAAKAGYPLSTSVRDAAIVWACDELGLEPEDHF